MSSAEASALVEELRRRNIVSDDARTRAPAPVEDRPWYISLVLGGAGWLAGVFALFFVFLLFEPETAAGMTLAGVVLIGSAFGLYVAGRTNAFLAQLALAFSIAGQLALVGAAIEATDSAAATAALTALLQLALLLVLPNRFAKVLAAFFFCIAWALTVRLWWWGEPTFGGSGIRVALLPALAGWLVVWVPIAAAVHASIAQEARWMATGARRIARPALVGLLVGLSLATWVSEPVASLRFWAPEDSYTNWLALWPLLATAAALFAAVSAFRLRDRALIGVAIAGALLHVGQFYYLLGVSLIAKSVVMLAVGAAMLVAARVLERKRIASLESKT